VCLELVVLGERLLSLVFIFKSYGAIVENIAVIKLNSLEAEFLGVLLFQEQDRSQRDIADLNLVLDVIDAVRTDPRASSKTDSTNPTCEASPSLATVISAVCRTNGCSPGFRKILVAGIRPSFIS
jgi:hypothetical protein